jgi:hypothetical protein
MTSDTSHAYLNGIGAWSDEVDFSSISLDIELYICSNLSGLSNIDTDLDGIGTWCTTTDTSTFLPEIVDSDIMQNTSIPTRFNISLADVERSLNQVTQPATECCDAVVDFRRFDFHQDVEAHDAVRWWMSHDAAWFLIG